LQSARPRGVATILFHIFNKLYNVLQNIRYY
jgi:hypothetical protein